MNILVLDEDPLICAGYHCDRDVERKILEYSELLKLAHEFLDGTSTAESRLGLRIDRRNRHAIHLMSAVWTRANNGNYLWLHELTANLLIEFHIRFKRENPYRNAIDELKALPLNMQVWPCRKFACSVPTNCKRESVTESYRAYYCTRDNMVWTPPAKIPEWYKLVVHEEVS